MPFRPPKPPTEHSLLLWSYSLPLYRAHFWAPLFVRSIPPDHTGTTAGRPIGVNQIRVDPDRCCGTCRSDRNGPRRRESLPYADRVAPASPRRRESPCPNAAWRQVQSALLRCHRVIASTASISFFQVK